LDSNFSNGGYYWHSNTLANLQIEYQCKQLKRKKKKKSDKTLIVGAGEGRNILIRGSENKTLNEIKIIGVCKMMILSSIRLDYTISPILKVL